MSDQTPHFFYRVLPNGKGWHWELVDTKNAVVERGIADERLRAPPMRFDRPSIGCKLSQNHTREAGNGPILFQPDQRPHSR